MRNEVFFLTSSRAKLMHARHMARPYGAKILGKPNYGVAYSEPRSLDRKEILSKSYQNALLRWSRSSGSSNAFFFIEDTSVIIDALSVEREFPGVDVKYWMRDISFADLDAQLKRLKRDRRATVRSDVLLHLPESFRLKFQISEQFKHFTGTTNGSVTKKEVPVETNLLYPWLDKRSFNKWFVPDGCRSPMSALPIELADKSDFRKDSVGAAFKYLSDHGVFDASEHRNRLRSPFLPNFVPPILLVVGLPCAGKTTLGSYLSRSGNYIHIEASDYMRRACYERHGIAAAVSIEDFATEALHAIPDIVVEGVLEEIEKYNSKPVVVTGFRSPEEIEIFCNAYRGALEIESWLVVAKTSIRFGRSCERGRSDAAKSLSDFKNRDTIQRKMGLGEIARLGGISTIRNESTIEDYVDRCRRKLKLPRRRLSSVRLTKGNRRPASLEDAVLLGLLTSKVADRHSTTEITHLLNRTFNCSEFETNKNNVSRFFNFRPSAYFSIESRRGVLKYGFSATGYSRALELRRIFFPNT